ncbi:MAG: hypothetical protein QM756_09150 [Polyangiaceae bacterium]
MTEVLALLLVHVAVTLCYAAGRVRGGARLALLESRFRASLARVVALVALATAIGLWRSIESGPASLLIVLVGSMALGTLVTLLGPLAPRLLWGATLLAASLASVLALWRGVS